MIHYGDKPDNQSGLPVTPEAQFVKDMRQWARDDKDAWERYLMIVKAESAFGELSPNYPIQILRHRHKVSIRNGAAPILARMALEEDDSIRFRLSKSKYDPYFEVVL